MGMKAKRASGRFPRPLGAPKVPAVLNQTYSGGQTVSTHKKCRTDLEPTGVGVRAPLSGDGGARQGRRFGVGGQRLVVVEATGWSKVATMEVRKGSGRVGRG